MHDLVLLHATASSHASLALNHSISRHTMLPLVLSQARSHLEGLEEVSGHTSVPFHEWNQQERRHRNQAVKKQNVSIIPENVGLENRQIYSSNQAFWGVNSSLKKYKDWRICVSFLLISGPCFISWWLQKLVNTLSNNKMACFVVSVSVLTQFLNNYRESELFLPFDLSLL